VCCVCVCVCVCARVHVSKMKQCSSEGCSKDAHKLCAFDFFKDMNVIYGQHDSSGSLRDPESWKKWGEELEEMDYSVCRNCHEGKLRELKSAATALKTHNSAPKREAYSNKDDGGGKDRRAGQVRHSSTRTHLYLFIYR